MLATLSAVVAVTSISALVWKKRAQLRASLMREGRVELSHEVSAKFPWATFSLREELVIIGKPVTAPTQGEFGMKDALNPLSERTEGKVLPFENGQEQSKQKEA